MSETGSYETSIASVIPLTDGHKCLKPLLGLGFVKSTSPSFKNAETLVVSGLRAKY